VGHNDYHSGRRNVASQHCCNYVSHVLIQLTCRLVGEDQASATDQGSSDARSLCLTSRQLSGRSIRQIAHGEFLKDTFRSFGDSGPQRRWLVDLGNSGCIIQDGPPPKQIERLRNPSSVERCILCGASRSVEASRAARWCQRTADQAEQGRLSASRRTEDCKGRAAEDLNGNVAKEGSDPPVPKLNSVQC
jgi:hypothetical protein